MAEATLHEGMAEERRRREEAERERDDLRRQLNARGRQREVHEAAEEQQGRGQPRARAGASPDPLRVGLRSLQSPSEVTAAGRRGARGGAGCSAADREVRKAVIDGGIVCTPT
jgi:hypothetical protein